MAPDAETEGVPPGTDAAERARPISMHERVAPWADHCSCGAEPYWLEVAAELGIDVDAGVEDEQEDKR